MKILTNNLLILVLILLSISCENSKSDNEQISDNRFIKPAFREVSIPFEEFVLNPEKGDTFVYSSGSVIVFPPNSIVDENGNIVKGDVKITYREFADPIDFFLSGIPMDYDSNGTGYTFESAAMCEIEAMVGNKKVYVNKSSRPEINYMSYNDNPNQNLYFLDTVQKKWINKGKDEISAVDEDVNPDRSFTNEFASENKYDPLEPVEPVKPLKASDDRLNFSIKIEPGSLPELQAYNNLLFEFVDANSVVSSDASVEWSDVKIVNTSKKGIYKVTFSNTYKTVSYKARPVFKGKSYDEALIIYEAKEKEYQALLTKRKDEELKAGNDLNNQIESDQKENERINKMNKVIIARNREIEEWNKNVSEKNSQYEKERLKRLEERRQKEAEAEKNSFKKGGYDMNVQIIRTFNIEKFGVWNCDYPVLNSMKQITANFVDNEGNALDLNSVTIVYKELNGIFTYYNGKIKIVPKKEQMIWAVYGNHFIYLKFKEFLKCKIDPATTEYTFAMNIYTDSIKSRDDIKRIVGL